MIQPTEQQIRDEAYLAWELKRRPNGMADYFWQQAKDKLFIEMNKTPRWAAAALVMMLIAVGSVHAQMVPWLTRSGDNQRSGWNSKETVLSQASVAKGVFLKEVIPVYGDRNGVEAQPLIVPQVKTKNGTQDVMVLCSMANQCRGVDAHTGADIWDQPLGRPVGPFNGRNSIDSWGINNNWGALSTGVIDPGDNRFYQVFWMSPDGTPQAARYYMAVLNVADGSQVVPPVMITGTSQGYDFNAQMRKARSSAVLLNQNGVRTVLQCTGTIQETASGAAGFCFAFDTYTNRVTAMLATTAGEGAGFWEAGQGLSCDSSSTYCYGITGNGDFDGKTQWGESFIQLQYTAPTATNPNGAKITINKGWSPWTDFQRSGQAQVPTGKLAGESMPSEAVRPVGGAMSPSFKNAKRVANVNDQGQFVTLVYPQMAGGAEADEDWGSSGPACFFQIGKCVGAGKDGEAYVLSVPGFTGTTAATAGTVANCQYANPVFLTASPGPVDPCPANPHLLNFFINGDTAHLHMTPVQMYDPVLKSWTLFAWGENQQLHKWAVSSAGKLTWIANGHEWASADVRDNPPGGMAGGECSGSSNGGDANSAILVCAVPRGDANKTVSRGDIIVYDPVHLGADGYLRKLWSSADWGWNITANKFMPPLIDGGEIIVPNYSGGVMVLTTGNAPN